MIGRGGPDEAIRISKIKKRRLEELSVGCHRGTNVGKFVPFYFCPRSVMLHILHKANHPELIVPAAVPGRSFSSVFVAPFRLPFRKASWQNSYLAFLF
jgi:hypothetical protein